jgi:hypothetical protein
MNWEKLQQVYILAKLKSVSFSINYCESDDSWYFEIYSSFKDESWNGLNTDFNDAIECIIYQLERTI